MIRNFHPQDTEGLIQIWLDASVLAHDFIPESYWKEKAEDMRTLYLPSAQVLVFENEQTNQPEGFVAMAGDHLAAIFVSPCCQGKGIGSRLLGCVRKEHAQISLAVYSKNRRSLDFYLKQGFVCQEERVDPDTGEKEWLMLWEA